MNYYVNLGGIIICGITGVSDEMGREINAYDSIGQGKFSVPDTAGLRTWTIECQLTEINKPFVRNWTAARIIFAGFDTLLNTKNPSRFIFTSQYRTDSLSAYLRSYTKTEKFPGVYDVSIQVVEYKPVGIKTTDVPYIQRPGKVPELPKVVVLNNKTTPYTITRKVGGGASTSSTDKTGGGASTSSTDKTGGNAPPNQTDQSTGNDDEDPPNESDNKVETFRRPSRSGYDKDLYMDCLMGRNPGGTGSEKAFTAIKNTLVRWRTEEIARREQHERDIAIKKVR